MGTNHEKYHETFEKIARAKPIKKSKINTEEEKVITEIPEKEEELVAA